MAVMEVLAVTAVVKVLVMATTAAVAVEVSAATAAMEVLATIMYRLPWWW